MTLLTFYKAETIKMKLRSPGNDPRRPVHAPMHRLSLLHYLKLLVTPDSGSEHLEVVLIAGLYFFSAL